MSIRQLPFLSFLFATIALTDGFTAIRPALTFPPVRTSTRLAFSDLTMNEGGNWITRVPEAAYTWANALVGEEFFIIPYRTYGGGSMYSLNINTLEWTTHESLPECHGFSAAAINEHQLVLVGSGMNFSPRIYDTRSRWWTILPPLMSRRDYCACVVDGSKIYAIGGRDGADTSLDTVEVLDLSFPPEERSWAILPSTMRIPRYCCAAELVGGKIYVVGGCNSSSNDQKLNSCEVFDLEQQVWSSVSLPPMTQARDGPSLVEREGKLIAMGGHDGIACLNTMEAFDLNSNAGRWEVLDERMKQARCCFAAAATKTGILVAGGFNSHGSMDTVEMLEPLHTPPQLPPIPDGLMDNEHKRNVERWILDVAAKRKAYEASIATAISELQRSCSRQKDFHERQIQGLHQQIQKAETEAEIKSNVLRQALESWNDAAEAEVAKANSFLQMMTNDAHNARALDYHGRHPQLPSSDSYNNNALDYPGAHRARMLPNDAYSSNNNNAALDYPPANRPRMSPANLNTNPMEYPESRMIPNKDLHNSNPLDYPEGRLITDNEVRNTNPPIDYPEAPRSARVMAENDVHKSNPPIDYPEANSARMMAKNDLHNHPRDIRQTAAEAAHRAPPQPPRTGEAPSELFFCPITREVMEDPVNAADGYTYERRAIESLLSRNPVSPMTRQSLVGTYLYPNVGIRVRIMEWKERNTRN